MYMSMSSLQDTTWSEDGLTTVNVTKDGDFVTIQCSSTHLTSFAVLVAVGGTQVLTSIRNEILQKIVCTKYMYKCINQYF